MTKKVLEILCFGLAFCRKNRGVEQGRGSLGASLGWGVACGVAGEGAWSGVVREGKAQVGGEKANVHFVRHRFMCNFATIYYRAL